MSLGGVIPRSRTTRQLIPRSAGAFGGAEGKKKNKKGFSLAALTGKERRPRRRWDVRSEDILQSAAAGAERSLMCRTLTEAGGSARPS